MVMEEKKETPQIVLTKPLSLEGDSIYDNYRAPSMLQRALSLFKNVRLGSDLSRMQLPPTFNVPKSQLQCYGESVYCVGDDMLRKCNSKESPSERFIAVVAWSISTIRPLIFGVAPYNPILGETHHVSRGTLNVLLEQVSHHPPVSALHATDEKENLELLWCHHPVPKFFGTSVEAEIKGTRKLKLLNHGETYVMTSPKLSIKFFPVSGVEWTGTDRIRCHETGLEVELSYGGRSFLGLKGNPRSVKGQIFETSSLKPLFEIAGHWDRTITVKDLTSGEVKIIYNSKEAISGLKTPIIKDPKGVWASESALVWGEVSQGILNKDWGRAREAKKACEEKQRELLRDRESRMETWAPKHFIVSYSKEGGWDCSPLQKLVPPAPIVVPFNSTSVEAEIKGTRKLKLLNYGETYVMNSLKLSIKFFPVPGVEWTGTDRIRCHETGLEVELSYGGRSFLGLKGNPRSVKGQILETSSLKPLFDIAGHWDRTITVKDLTSGEVKIICNSKEAISGLKTPIIKDPKGVWASESALVWGEVSQGILNNDWGRAREAKKDVEEKQRELLRDRESRMETWAPKHFIVSYSKEGGWDCSPLQKLVPPAPIVVPFNS